MSNPFLSTKLEFHILQSFPVTCLNRDDVGSPKSAIVGGVTRARVSSQCWKRQVRLAMHDFGIKLAHRSKHFDEQLVKRCMELGASEEKAKDCAQAMADTVVKDALFFFTDTEIDCCAKYAQEKDFCSDDIKAKEVLALVKKSLKLAVDGLDIALFGRMVALAPDLNIQAAASFSHAISTHAVSTELDFFTALDDLDPTPGAAHMDNLEFNSATYYRYISLDLGQLYESLGGENVVPSVCAFIKALFVAVPSARQNTVAGACPWDYAKILLRKGQGIQLSFDKPVKAKGGYVAPSIEALKADLAAKEKLFGSLFGKISECEIGGSESTLSIDDVLELLSQKVGALND